MVALTSASWLVVLILATCFEVTDCLRRFDRRTDLDDVPPVNISAADWTLPLRGSSTCAQNGICTDSLTPPPAGKALQFLAVARGIYTYTCTGGGAEEAPGLQSQSTQLYDAAQVISRLPNEASFHSLIPRLYGFDYGELKNSTLDCIGTIGTINSTAIITLFDVATFEAQPYESIRAPDEPADNGRWGHSRSPGLSWDVYRVEVTGGAPPVCGDRASAIETEYAAEYWFYHSGGEDLWTSLDPGKTQDQSSRMI